MLHINHLTSSRETFASTLFGNTGERWKANRATQSYLDSGFLKKINLVPGCQGWSLGREISVPNSLRQSNWIGNSFSRKKDLILQAGDEPL